MSADAARRFFAKVDRHRADGCWAWIGSFQGGGYGTFYADGKSGTAHKWAYRFMVGEVPDGMHLDHLCRNRWCVNPFHLEPVTPRENVMRGEGPAAKNAVKTHCAQGHEYTPSNTRMYTGRRECITCNRNKSREYQRRKRANA